jgi:hypothetical protein
MVPAKKTSEILLNIEKQMKNDSFSLKFTAHFIDNLAWMLKLIQEMILASGGSVR